MTAYLLLFLAGAAGSFHCAGMCGGFACAMGADPRGRSATLRRHLIYNSARVTVYCFLGALAGFLGAALVLYYHGGDNPVTTGQRLLALASGALMVVIGMQFLGWFMRFRPGRLGRVGRFFADAFRDLLSMPGPAAPLAFGVFNGFLPCPLVYAFLAQAAASGGPLPGFLVMAAFGLGTFPTMLLLGGIGAHLSVDWRLRGVRIAGLFILGFGLITLARGIVPLAEHNQSALALALAWCSSLSPGLVWSP